MGVENRKDSIADAFILCPCTKITKKLLTMHKHYPNAAGYLSNATGLGINKQVQIPPYLRRQNVVKKGVKEYRQLTKDLGIKLFT